MDGISSHIDTSLVDKYFSNIHQIYPYSVWPNIRPEAAHGCLISPTQPSCAVLPWTSHTNPPIHVMQSPCNNYPSSISLSPYHDLGTSNPISDRISARGRSLRADPRHVKQKRTTLLQLENKGIFFVGERGQPCSDLRLTQ